MSRARRKIALVKVLGERLNDGAREILGIVLGLILVRLGNPFALETNQ